MTLQNTIKKWIHETLSPEGDFVVEHPGDMSHGDFATNIALTQSKRAGKNPRVLADEYVGLLTSHMLEEIKEVSVAGPGFINIVLKPEVFALGVSKIIHMGKHVGNHIPLSGKKILIEYAQPNPFKEFHIGHMMNIIIGESISRILEAQGNEVIRVTYHGDVGLHVAKAIWGLRSMDVGGDITVEKLGKAYATGAKLFESDSDVQKEIIEINKKIYDGSDDEVNTLYRKGRSISLDYFETLYVRFGSHFDHHFYESETGQIGKDLVLEFLNNGVFEKSESAVIFPGEKYGLHTRVYVNSEGLPTYEAKEVGLAKIKKDMYGPYDMSITVTANEQDSFFTVVEKSLEYVFPDLSGKLLHLSHGMLRLPTGKMSSRTGDVVTAESLIETVRHASREKLHERIMSDEEKEKLSEMVALGALKFTILRQAIGGDIVFDVNQALSLEGDSGPYLQYATVRAHTLLKKSEGVFEPNSDMPSGWQTTNLERLLVRYPQVVERACTEYAPHHIVTYLTELAGEFNSFYASHKIIDVSDSTSPYRLSVTQAFRYVMINGLGLLGIGVPEQM